MSAGAPWSVKGIDPKAREVAKDLARRSGMTLGEWLNRMILEEEDDVPDEVTVEAQFGGASRLRAFAPPAPMAAVPEGLRVAQALERLTDRIEAAETRTGFAIGGVERQVREALARLDTAERQTFAVSSRVQESEARETALTERLRLLEAGARSPEALQALQGSALDAGQLAETVLERLADRLADAEGRTTAALGELADSLALLDNRLGAVERKSGAQALEQRFQTLSDSLTRQIEATRGEVAKRLEAAGGGDVEARLAQMAEHIRVAEVRSREAVERIGREVLSMAEAVNTRLVASEERSAEAIDLVGTEIARVAGAVEARLARAEHTQASTLDRLTAEVSEVTVRFAERMEAADRRSAEAIQSVGDQVARLAAQLEQRGEVTPRAEADREPLVEPAPEAVSYVAATEWARAPIEVEALVDEPDAQALEADAAEPEAADLDVLELEALASTATEAGELDVAETIAAEAEAVPPAAEPDTTPSGPFGPELFSRAEDEPEANDILAAVLAKRFGPEDYAAADGFAPLAEPEDDIFAAEIVEDETSAAEAKAEPEGGLSTREVIEQARAAARAALEAGQAAGVAEPTEMRAQVDRRAATGRLFNGFGQSKARRANSPLHTALMVAGGAAFLSVGAAGVVLMERPAGQTPEAFSPFGASPRAAVALAPAKTTTTQAAARAPAEDAAVLEVMQQIAERRPGALAKLKGLADGGDAMAQLRLAELYASGEAGVVHNMAEARRWTALAAEGGLPRAMHNLAVYYFRGEGGPQDLASAAQWFRKAAEEGLTESQFNLAVMYQTGSGVQKDPAEALRWYRAAAEQGDGQAAAAAERLSPSVLTPPQAKRALFELGYFKGPIDAQETPDFRAALSNYQRDNGQAVTGQLDPKTAALLSAHR